MTKITFGDKMKNKLFIQQALFDSPPYQLLMNEGDQTIIINQTFSYNFKYKNVKFSEAPYTKEKPQYNNNAHKENSLFNLITLDHKTIPQNNSILTNFFELNYDINKKSSYKSLDLIIEFFSSFDEIIYICDLSPSGCRGFDFKFQKYFKLGEDWITFFKKIGIKVSVMKRESIDKHSLIKSFEKRDNIENSKEYNIAKESYLKKDFFEYNYNLNSILFFNDVLNNIGYIKDSNQDNIVLTKNYILILFLIYNNKSIHEDKIIELSHKIGVGHLSSKYTSKVIINSLLKMKLIKFKFLEPTEIYNNPNRKKDYLALSNIGLNFINNIHKKINDPYLSIRLLKDNYIDSSNVYTEKSLQEKTLKPLDITSSKLSLEDFYFKYEKYLYTSFSKQKKFLRKIKRTNN
jgi:hypothetical protein